MNHIYKKPQFILGELIKTIGVISLTFVISSSVLKSQAIADDTKGMSAEEIKALHQAHYLTTLEDELDLNLNVKIKNKKLKISNQSELVLADEAKIHDMKCHSIRGFFKNEGIVVGKIDEKSIDSLSNALGIYYNKEVKTLLTTDFSTQRERYYKDKEQLKKDKDNGVSRIPAFCFAEIEDKYETNHTVYVSPLLLMNSSDEITVLDVNHQQKMIEIEKTIKDENKNDDKSKNKPQSQYKLQIPTSNSLNSVSTYEEV